MGCIVGTECSTGVGDVGEGASAYGSKAGWMDGGKIPEIGTSYWVDSSSSCGSAGGDDSPVDGSQTESAMARLSVGYNSLVTDLTIVG